MWLLRCLSAILLLVVALGCAGLSTSARLFVRIDLLLLGLLLGVFGAAFGSALPAWSILIRLLLVCCVIVVLAYITEVGRVIVIYLWGGTPSAGR